MLAIPHIFCLKLCLNIFTVSTGFILVARSAKILVRTSENKYDLRTIYKLLFLILNSRRSGQITGTNFQFVTFI